MIPEGVTGSGPVKINVQGLRRTLRALEKAGADAGSMRTLMHEIGMIVVRAAAPKAPYLTGSLRGNIRAGRGKTKAVVRAGGARVPYAPVVHYGWPERGISPQPFLVSAAQQQRPAMFAKFEQGVGQLLHKNNLT